MLSVDDMLNYLEHLIHVAHVPAHAGQEVPPEALAAHGIENYVFSTIRAGTSLNRNRVSRVQAGKGQSVSSYILKMKSYIDNLECLGYCVSLNLAVSLILVSLRKEYDSFVQNYNYDGTGETVNELHAMLKLHEQTLLKKDAPALLAIRVGKGLRGSRKLKPGALNLYVGNGHRAADYDLDSAARILNIVPTKKVEKTSYKKTIGYSFYYPPENKVLVARNAEFFENSLITQEASGSLKDIKIIQLKDTYPSVNTSSHHDEDEQEIDEPQSNIFPIRRSTKTRHALYQMCLYIDAEEHELGYLNETANYKASLLDPESDK
ncbi:hypothetical protein Tco_0031427 [Tanacetum coccineum]